MKTFNKAASYDQKNGCHRSIFNLLVYNQIIEWSILDDINYISILIISNHI